MKSSKVIYYLFQAFDSLESRYKRKLGLAFGLRTLLASFDVVSLVLVAGAASLLTAGFGSFPPQLNFILDILGTTPTAPIEERVSLIALVGSFAVAIFLLRSLLSVLMERKILFLAAEIEASQGKKLFRKYLEDLRILRLSVQESTDLTHMTVIGLQRTYSTLLGRGVVTLSDAITASLIFATVLLVNPLLALVTLVYLGSVSLVLWKLTQSPIRKASRELRSQQMKVISSVKEYQSVSKELWLSGNLRGSLDEISRHREQASKNFASVTFLQGMTRYLFEFALILGAFTFAATAFLTGGLAEASNSFIVFSVAAARLSPISIGLFQFANLTTATVPDAEPILDRLRGRF